MSSLLRAAFSEIGVGPLIRAGFPPRTLGPSGAELWVQIFWTVARSQVSTARTRRLSSPAAGSRSFWKTLAT